MDREFDINAHSASLQCDISQLMFLREKIIAMNCYDLSPLHLASKKRSSESASVVKHLLEYKPDLGIKDHFGYTALHYAAKNSDCMVEVIKLLLDHGADISAVDYFGYSPLHLALSNSKCTLDVVKLLCCTAVINHAAVDRRITPLHCALDQNGMNLDVIKYLLDNGANVNGVDEYGDTPLVYYLRTCSWDINVLKLLLDRGASTYTVNESGTSPFQLGLYFVCFTPCIRDASQSMDCMKLLIAHVCIEYPRFDVEDVIKNCLYCDKFSQFAKKCVSEIQNLKKEYISGHCTLYDLISRQQVHASPNEEEYDIYKLLRTLASNKYPVYKEFISSRVDRASLLNELEKLVIYTRLSNEPCLNTNLVELDCASVFIIARYLSNCDLINVIIAFADHYGESPKLNVQS